MRPTQLPAYIKNALFRMQVSNPVDMLYAVHFSWWQNPYLVRWISAGNL